MFCGARVPMSGSSMILENGGFRNSQHWRWRIVRILLGGCKRAGRLPERIVVSDTDSTVLAELKAQFGSALTVTAESRQPAAQDLVLFALHPPALSAALDAIKGALRPGAVVISLAPKWLMARSLRPWVVSAAWRDPSPTRRPS